MIDPMLGLRLAMNVSIRREEEFGQRQLDKVSEHTSMFPQSEMFSRPSSLCAASPIVCVSDQNYTAEEPMLCLIMS